jgi:hypothetical protein
MITRIEIDGCKSFLDFKLDVPDVEQPSDPTKVLVAVLPATGHRVRDDYFGYLGQRVDLTVLARLSADAAWASEAERAWEGLGYV